MMKKILLACTLLFSIGMLAMSCSKDNGLTYNEHAFTEQQTKVMDILPGVWRNGSDCFYHFKEQYDTNTVAYENDFVNGPREKYTYQGVVSYLILSSNGIDTAQYYTYHYYVSRDASNITMYRPSDGSKAYRSDLTVVDATHIKLKREGSSFWLEFIKTDK